MFKAILNKYKKMSVITKAALWFVICTMLQKCISFITVPIFTRLMPAEEYGLYSTYLSWYNIITVICTLNMHNCIYMNGISKAKTEKEKNDIAIPMLSLSEVITVILFFIYFVFHNYLNEIIKLPTILVSLIFAQVLFDPAINFWLVRQRFEYKYVKVVIRTITMVVLNSVLGIIFVVISTTNQAIARAISIILVQALFGIVLYVYFFKKGKKIFSCKDWKHILNVQLPLLPHGLSLTILGSSDKIMINSLCSAIQAGIYSVAYSAGYVVNILKNSIVDALRPWTYEQIKEKKYNDINQSTKPILLLILIITFIFIVFAPEIIKIMAPPDYYEAIYVIPPVAASAFFTFLYNMFSTISFYYEKTKKIMFASLAGAIFNIVLNAICIPTFGYIAAGYTTLVCYIFLAFVHFLIMNSICKSELNNAKIFDVRFIISLSAIVLIVMLVLTLLYDHLVIRYGIILILLLTLIIKRKEFINAIKTIKKKKV